MATNANATQNLARNAKNETGWYHGEGSGWGAGQRPPGAKKIACYAATLELEQLRDAGLCMPGRGWGLGGSADLAQLVHIALLIMVMHYLVWPHLC